MMGIEDVDEAWRVATRTDVMAALGVEGANDDERRAGNEGTAVSIQPVELLGAHQL
jgi:hypothetical protein